MNIKLATFSEKAPLPILADYDEVYDATMNLALDALTAKKSSQGITAKEDNMIFQLKTYLGIDTNLLSQRDDAPKTKDIGIESYN